MPLRITFDYATCTLDSRNFSKGDQILFVIHLRMCVTVAEIYVGLLIYYMQYVFSYDFKVL